MEHDRTKRVPDVPLTFFWKASRAVEKLIDLPPAPTRKVARAMASIALAAIIEAPSGQRISYSRRREFYAVPARYRGTDYSYDAVIPAVELLVAAGILVDHVIAPSGPKGCGWQSSFLPSPRLGNLDPGRLEQVLGETIKLKDPKGRLVDYEDTKATKSDRARVRRINRALARHRVEVASEAGGIRHGDVLRFPGSGGREGYAVNLRRVGLYRVYSGGWTLGGRLYGAWYQSVRSSVRSCLLIDGKRVAEVDYRSLHGLMLYAHAGVHFRGDVYAVPGQDRSAVKAMFNIMLNAGSRLAARLAFLADHDFAHWDAGQAEALIGTILRYHAPVAHLMNTGLGLRFQNLDAGMAMEVVEEMSVRRGVGCLPVHDSFVVPAEHVEELVAVMSEVFRKALPGCGDPSLKIKLAEGLDRIHLAKTIPHREGGCRAGPGVGGASGPVRPSGGPEPDSTRMRAREALRPCPASPAPAVTDDPGYWSAVEASLAAGEMDWPDDTCACWEASPDGVVTVRGAATSQAVPRWGDLSGEVSLTAPSTSEGETGAAGWKASRSHVGSLRTRGSDLPLPPEAATASCTPDASPKASDRPSQSAASLPAGRGRRPAFLDRIASREEIERVMVAERAAAPLSQARSPLRLRSVP